jgi:predicted RNA binding protein YcfA (HicA-like mRNA interferase family)
MSIKKLLEERKMKGKDPCWKGYEMIGMKDKNGKKVPNCVPEETEVFYKEDLDEQILALDEMPGANMDTRAVHQHLKKSGWSLARTSGGHDIYSHPDAKHTIPVPRHRQLKAPLVLGILKSSKLRKEEVESIEEAEVPVSKIHKIIANTQSADHGVREVMRVLKVSEAEARKHVNRAIDSAMKEETELDEEDHPKLIGYKPVDKKTWDAHHSKMSDKQKSEYSTDMHNGYSHIELGKLYKISKSGKAWHYIKEEALKGKQHKLDVDKDGKIEGEDLAKLRSMKEDEIETSDYKIDKRGRKYRAHRVVFNKGEEEMKEELVGKQHKLDINKNNKIDSEDLAKLRKMKKEDAELDERELTDAEMKERERIVKGMKKSYKDFKGQYGSRGKEVMYATATKLAKEEFSEDILEELEQIEELSKSTLGSYIKKAARSANARSSLSGRFDNEAEHGKDYKQIASNEKLASDFAKDARKRVKGISKATDRLTKEEAEQIDELSKSTLMSYAKKAEAEAGEHGKKAIAAWEKGDKEADEKHFKKMSARSGGAGMAAYKASMKNEEAEQIDELSKSTLGSYIKKAARSASARSSLSGRFDNEAEYGKDYKQIASNEKLASDFAKDARKRITGINKATDRLAKEELDLDEAMKPYVSGDHKDGWSILDSKGKEVKKFHHSDYVDHPIADKKAAAKNDAMAYLKKNFSKLSEETLDEMTRGKEYTKAQLMDKIKSGNWEATTDIKPGKHVELRHHSGKRVVVQVKHDMSENTLNGEILLGLCEEMIDRDDFDNRIRAYKKAGYKVLDTKHGDTRAHISFVDSEGVHRTVKYTPTGKSMQNHGPYEGGKKDTSGEKVNKSEVKTITRGRGRPRKDKFAESVDILLSLSEEEFNEIMEDSSLDEIVVSLCNLSEEELKELKG